MWLSGTESEMVSAGCRHPGPRKPKGRDEYPFTGETMPKPFLRNAILRDYARERTYWKSR